MRSSLRVMRYDLKSMRAMACTWSSFKNARCLPVSMSSKLKIWATRVRKRSIGPLTVCLSSSITLVCRPQKNGRTNILFDREDILFTRRDARKAVGENESCSELPSTHRIPLPSEANQFFGLFCLGNVFGLGLIAYTPNKTFRQGDFCVCYMAVWW